MRQTQLSMLREYFKQHKSKDYLFEGEKGSAYSVRSVQEILKKAKTLAKVNKPGSVHALRHSFATHLMDKGRRLP